MKLDIYHKTAAFESVHWWFIGRRSIVKMVLDRLHLANGAQILEVGCGTGGNLPLLAQYGAVQGMEIDATARAYAAARGIAPVSPGSLPQEIPFPHHYYDLIVLTDVLEHVDEDELSLKNLNLRLKPRGYLLVTVPAYAGLWSGHDESHHHKRRYTKGTLNAMIKRANFDIIISSYFNTLLFPAIAGLRLGQKLLQRATTDDLKMPPAGLNRFLARVFAAERHFLPHISLPFGVSLLVLGRKPV
ncbi:MAG: class I SAM-dependent methyltransferase [Syntrophobacterales bacterium]|jgi:SAM-dependent methyltransferase|nr:class I SAM-dependent methyltransferase [Syntrophobacterales bacterium]